MNKKGVSTYFRLTYFDEIGECVQLTADLRAVLDKPIMSSSLGFVGPSKIILSLFTVLNSN